MSDGYRRREEAEKWLRCPSCGSEDVVARNASYCESLFVCQDCDESLVQTW